MFSRGAAEAIRQRADVPQGGHKGRPYIVSQRFVIAVLLFYAGLVMAFVLWNLGRWLRNSGKRRERPAILERSSARRIFHRPFDAS